MAFTNMRSALPIIATLISVGIFNTNAAAECTTHQTGLAYQTPTQQAIKIDKFTDAKALLIQPQLTGKTTRYLHGVFDEKFEFTTLSLNEGKTDFTLSAPHVFEDRQIRLTDLDQNGQTDFLQVVANGQDGARLLVLELNDNTLEVKAQSQPIGLGNRWLNPIGVGDFDGDGQLEVASVRTPHIGGIVEIHELQGSNLVKTHTMSGFSNHRYGSKEQGLAAVLATNGKKDKIVLVNQNKDVLHILELIEGKLKVTGAYKPESKVLALSANGSEINIALQNSAGIKAISSDCFKP